MNYSLLSAFACILVIVIVAAVVLVKMLLKPNPDESKNTAKIPSKNQTWQSWLIPAVVALLLAIWTILGALFFLAVVWVLRMNPGSDISFTLKNNEKNAAQLIYLWLLLSPIVTIPILLIAVFNLSYNSATPNEKILAALLPLIVHIPLLFGLNSKSGFVYRHTQQGLLLIALRAGMASLAAINVEAHDDYALSLFLLGNGALWFFGSIAGWSQISQGKCWFMDRKGEKIILPEAVQPAKPNDSVLDKELNSMVKSLDPKGLSTAKQEALSAFQNGTPEIKKRAIVVLSQLGEVEKF